MERLTAERVNGIKTGYWSPAKKDELVQRLAEYEDVGPDPSEIRKQIQQYREMDRKLREAYGDCDGLLERSVDLLCEHAGIDIGEPIKARLLTDEDVDKWDAYREIGTVEECREAREKQKPQKPFKGADFMVVRGDDGSRIWESDYICHECGMGITREYICCPYCGTYIDWSKEGDKSREEDDH